MSPASRAVRDVELTALEHVRPVEPGKQLRFQEPHAPTRAVAGSLSPAGRAPDQIANIVRHQNGTVAALQALLRQFPAKTDREIISGNRDVFEKEQGIQSGSMRASASAS
jgi:hypothetical protein